MAQNTDNNQINSRKYSSDFYTTVPIQESTLSEYVHGIPKTTEGELLDPTEIICIGDYENNNPDLDYIDPNIMNCNNCNQPNCQNCDRMVGGVEGGGGGGSRYLNNINTIGGSEHVFLQSTRGQQLNRTHSTTVEVIPRAMNSYGYVGEPIQIDRPPQHPQQVYYQNMIDPQNTNQLSINQLNINNQIHQQINDQPVLQHNNQQIIINNLNKQIDNQPHHHHYIGTKPTAQAVKQVFQQGGTKRPRIGSTVRHVESNIPPPTPNNCQNYIEKNPPIRIQRRPSDSNSVVSNDLNYEKSIINDVQYQQVGRNGGQSQNAHKLQSNYQRVQQPQVGAPQNIQPRLNKNFNSSYNSNTSSSSSGNRIHRNPNSNKTEQTMNVHNGDVINITNQKTENTIMINTYGQNPRRKFVTVHSDQLNRDISVPSDFGSFGNRSQSAPGTQRGLSLVQVNDGVGGDQFQNPQHFQIQNNPQVQNSQSLRHNNQMHTLQPILESDVPAQPSIKQQYQESNSNNKVDRMIDFLADSDEEDETIKKQENGTMIQSGTLPDSNKNSIKRKKYEDKIREIATKEPGADFQKNYQKTQRVVRNNPWGQMSYKDMITDAIISKSGNKAKLSDIYTFMINEYEYFNKRQDMDGRKQWSNSVRHNLSSHKDMFFNEKEDTSKKPFGTKLGGYWSLHPDKLEIALDERADKKKQAEKEAKKR